MICLIGSSIIKPTIISTGAVAAAGIDKNSGEKNNATTKQHATTKAVRPERPPCATPDALSTYVVVVEVPKHAPMVVAIASAINASFKRSIFPFSSAFSMPGRILAGGATAGEITMSIAILLATAVVLAVISIKVYSGAVLHYGKRLNLKELFKLSREK